jgi:asparagine synthase (glutamine-hydrolysing)
MCGIVGIRLRDHRDHYARAEIAATVELMSAEVASRGPDERGIWADEKVVFGHRRLSIIDLSSAGSQPMRLRPDGPVIVFNGEIYNFQDLRHQLDEVGSTQWRGRSDTEVILRAYDRWGLEGLKRLEGIFAIALWDRARKRFLLMRDRLGVKPLFFGECRFGLAFGSQIRAVLAAGGVARALDQQALREFMWFGNVLGDRTIYAGVKQLSPGNWFIQEGEKTVIEPWFRLEEWLEPQYSAKTFNEALEEVRATLKFVVGRQLVSDVPVGIFLSGGVDSSALAVSAVKSGVRPETYTATFDFKGGINELEKARAVARHLGLKHHHIPVQSTSLLNTMTRLAQAHGQPFADAADIPLFLMAESLKGRCKVVLQGDGGDELFAGYRRYSSLCNARLWRLWPSLISPIARSASAFTRRAERLADAVGTSDPGLRMAKLLTIETRHAPPEAVFTQDRRIALEARTDPFLAFREAALRFSTADPIQQMLLTDITLQLPHQFLPKVDVATMAAGVEARVPLLDDRMVKLVAAMPIHWKLDATGNKRLLRAALKSELPKNVTNQSKTGFGVPYEEWLRTSLYPIARDNLLNPGFVDRFNLDARCIEGLLRRHRARVRDHGFTLWKLLQLSVWSDVDQADRYERR